MILRRLAVALVVLGALVASLFVWLTHGSASRLPRRALELPPQRASTWSEVFAHGAKVGLCTLQTGQVGGDRSFLLRRDHRDADHAHERDPLPIYAHLIRHPERGDALVDAGLSAAFEREPFGDLRAPMRLFHRAMGTSFSLPEGESVGAQLARLGARPRTVFLTHVHPDHIAGIEELPADATIVTGAGEADDPAGRAGYGLLRDGTTLAELDFARGVPMPPFASAIDVWGDGSLWAIATPGHSRGHVSFVVNARSGPALLVGDASHYTWAFEHGIGPRGPTAADEARGQDSLDRLRAFAAAYPEVRLVFGHDAPQRICDR